MKKGFFITLEGPDGCGKTTQARLLADAVTARGFEVILTREPGGTPLAEEIRHLLLKPREETVAPEAEILLYAATRAQHVETLIKPSVLAGKVVICERFIDSSLAYQGYGLGRDLEMIRQINRMATGGFEPALTFLLDLDTAICSGRMRERSRPEGKSEDRIESRGMVFLERVRQGYLDLAREHDRIQLIPVADKTIMEVHLEMLKILTNQKGFGI